MAAGSNATKVFITGIAGFTGFHLEEHLAFLGYDVYGTVAGVAHRANHYTVDLLDKKRTVQLLKEIRPEYIIHLAAISFVATDNLQSMYSVNLIGTVNLLESIIESGITINKVLLASSAAVYGNLEGELDESMCAHPVNHYGNSKLAMENAVRTFHGQLPCVTVRPFNYTGPGQASHFLVPKIVNHFVERNSYIELGNIDVYREFNDIRYVLDAYAQLLFSNVESEIVNVCTGRAICINDILETLTQLTEHKLEVRVNPAFVRKNEIRCLTGSIKKLSLLLGEHKLRHYSLEETLNLMLGDS